MMPDMMRPQYTLTYLLALVMNRSGFLHLNDRSVAAENLIFEAVEAACLRAMLSVAAPETESPTARIE